MTAHDDLLARHREVLPSWLALNHEHPIALVDGEGRHVTDAEGRRYLDFFGGILTTMVGHAVPEVVDAIRTQAGRMVHTSTLYLVEPMIALAEQIARLSTIPDAKVFFTTSGTEANEAALLVASTVRRSNQVLALRNSYHGRSFATMGMTGNRGWSPSSLSPFVVHYVQNGYRFRSPFGHLDDAGFTAAVVADLRDVLLTCTSGDVAAMVIEPIQGVGGFTVPPDGMWGAVQEVLREHGILYVSDEVQTGWGRTGDHFWGFQAHGVQPDLLTFAKGIGNGLPIAGVVGRGELMDSVTANSISTFGGGPLVAAGALATLQYVLDHDLQANAAQQGARIRAVLDPQADRFAGVGEVRGRGLMIGVELVDPVDGITPDPAAAAAVMEACLHAGLLVGKGGLFGNCLRVAPPLSVTAEEADEGATILAAAIESVLGA
ncbi:aspartate aminotransferase family protein [Aquihabitans sp. G128]|uniref:aspartate aminotransferase family protein n=1 Tax=Aquihabitans sp. G128 TaxID=2849779 RepID=UPI001C22CD8C|nr:aspartate aminotransferase family protein [Aquihabitans sp. G128]QXC61813.1 aspartate aminotransferase family protein [Aquihabitans sp. G128]